MPIKIPDIPSTPIQVPQIPAPPKLLCDANAALTQVTQAKKQIKELLKNKKAATATLLGLIPEVNSVMNDVKAIQETVSSFQSELKAISTSKNPVQIAQFIEKWSGSVTGLTSLVSQAQAISNDPKAIFNYCTDAPNFNLNPLTGKVKLGSLSAIIPNTNPAEAESLVNSIVDNTKKTTIGASGTSFSEVRKYTTSVSSKIHDIAKTITDPRERNKLLTYADRKTAAVGGVLPEENLNTYRENIVADSEYPEDSALAGKLDEIDAILEGQETTVAPYARYMQNDSLD